ncbi:MAG: cysteine desulfurase [Candidatus Kerfeldbacteria bacterium]|nr:cysteine desulfurase [Candidatus Kerfeldbacteria bacterium]
MNRIIREKFPILEQMVNGKPVAYLDNAATTQKPQAVIDATSSFYSTTNANVHRGIYQFAETATAAYEAVREQVRNFVRARRVHEIIFTRGTTEALNLIAATWGRANVKPGDAILVTEMEHHSNLVPWQQLALSVGAELRFVPVTDDGRLDLSALPKLLDSKVRLFAFTACSNVLGTMNPVKELVKKAHAAGALALVDAAQAAAHLPIDVQSWDCDFLALSGHKMYGPTGIGALYGKQELLEQMPPFLFGGDMILEVKKDVTTWNELPYKFEAGTPNIAGVIGWAPALDLLTSLGWEAIMKHEQELTRHGLEILQRVPGLTLYGPTTAEGRGGVFSFTIDGIHPHDLATIFDEQGIAIRAGHHCAQPLMDRYGVPAMARASCAIYTTKDELDRIPKAIERARQVLFGTS